MRKFQRVLRDGLGGLEVVVQLLVFREFGGEDVADLVGDALAVLGDGFAGEVLILRHFGEDRLDAVGHAGGNLVDLFVLHALGFLGAGGEWVVGLDLASDGFGQGVHALGVELLNLLVGAEHVGFATSDGVAEHSVGGFDLLAVFLGGGLERVVLFAERSQFGLLAGGHVGDGLVVKPERGAGDEDGRQKDRRKLLFKFLPHVGWGWVRSEASG